MADRVKILNDNLTFILKVILKQYSILTINGKKYKVISRDVKPPKYYYGKISQSSKRPYQDEIQYPTIYYDFGNDLSQQKALYKRSGSIGNMYLRTDVNVLIREISGGKLQHTCDEKYQILRRMFKELAPMLNPEKKNDLDGKPMDSDQTLINNIMKSGRSQMGGGSSIYGKSKKKRYTKRVKKKKTTRRKRRSNYT